MNRGISRFKSLVFPLFLLCAGCAGVDRLPPETTAPERLYNHALDQLTQKLEYTKAAQSFEEIDRYYPYSRWALKAQIMLAFTDYAKRDYDDAVVVLDRFIQLYPGNVYAPYAYYLKAMCYYAQLSDTRRDQKMTEMALNAFDEVIRRFPDTDYAKDAERRLALTLDYLAAKEVNVGYYYLKGGNWLSAMNRFSNAVQNYETTRHVQEALFRLTETYLILGLNDQAQKAAAVLGYNYPKSVWYKKAYALMKKYDPSALAKK